jgi:hypothetical protein
MIGAKRQRKEPEFLHKSIGLAEPKKDINNNLINAKASQSRTKSQKKC